MHNGDWGREQKVCVKRSRSQASLEVVGGRSNGLIRLRRTAREAEKPCCIESFLPQFLQELAQPDACVTRVLVGRILGISYTALDTKGDEVGLWDGEQRPEMEKAVPPGDCIHAAQACNSGSSYQTKDHGLRLIVRMMGRRYAVGADRASVLREKFIARLARPSCMRVVGFAPVQTRVA